MPKKSKHVVPNQKGGWSVRTAGTSKAGRIFDTKEKAVTYARTSAKKESGELYVHKKDGSITERRSYSKGPSSLRGKR